MSGCRWLCTCPLQNAQRVKCYPAARLSCTFARADVELIRALCVELPAAVGRPLALDDVKRFTQPFIVSVAFAEVVERPKQVVVITGRKRELCKFRVDQLTCRQSAHQMTFEQVFLTSLQSVGYVGKSASALLVLS